MTAQPFRFNGWRVGAEERSGCEAGRFFVCSDSVLLPSLVPGGLGQLIAWRTLSKTANLFRAFTEYFLAEPRARSQACYLDFCRSGCIIALSDISGHGEKLLLYVTGFDWDDDRSHGSFDQRSSLYSS